jgi:hypothetical protein
MLSVADDLIERTFRNAAIEVANLRDGSATSDLRFPRHVRCDPGRRHLLAPQYLTKRANSGHQVTA